MKPKADYESDMDKIRIVIVDDHRIVRNSVRAILDNATYAIRHELLHYDNMSTKISGSEFLPNTVSSFHFAKKADA